MSDLISRQAAIDMFQNLAYDDWNQGASTTWANAFSECAEMIRNFPSAEPEIIRCKDCKHKPHPSDSYDYDNDDCGFEIIFPDYRCPCQCEDEYYNRIPDDDWYCGNAERRTDG